MKDNLNFAIIGCGRIGARRINVLKNLPSASIVCVTDIDETQAKKIANENKCEYYTDFKKAIERNDIDCVIVATPNKFHAPITIGALTNGKHVLCEKPLARNLEEAKAMVKTAEENRVFLKTGSNLRYFSILTKAKELFDTGQIGAPLFIRGWIGHNIMKWTGNSTNSWLFNKDMVGGGTFLDNGVHVIDLVRWFFGDFDECIGHVQNKFLPIELEDNGVGLFTTKEGKMALIQSSWTEWCGYLYMEIYGTKGYLHINNRTDLNTSKLTFGDKGGISETFDFSNEPPRSYELELRDYINAIKEGRQPTATGYDGMKAVQMVEAVYKSSKLGQKVELSSLE